jgi:hypothetical protein
LIVTESFRSIAEPILTNADFHELVIEDD